MLLMPYEDWIIIVTSISAIYLLPQLGVTLAAVFTVLMPHRKNHYFLEIKIKSDWGQIKYEAVKHRINSKFLFYSIYYNILVFRIWAKVVLLIFEKYNMRSMRWKCVWTYVVTLLFHGLRNGFFCVNVYPTVSNVNLILYRVIECDYEYQL